MKLYYTPGACSLNPHILCHEAGLKHDLVKVDLTSKKTEDGRDFKTINPKGYVPCLELDDGTIVTENIAIDLTLSKLAPKAGIAPAPESAEFIPFIEHLGFVSTELHKGIGSLFSLPEDAKDMVCKKVATRLAIVEQHLKGKEFAFGNRFTAIDAYLFTVLSWAPKTGVDLSGFPAITAYFAKLVTRPSVQGAMKMEGIEVPQSKAA